MDHGITIRHNFGTLFRGGRRRESELLLLPLLLSGCPDLVRGELAGLEAWVGAWWRDTFALVSPDLQVMCSTVAHN